MQSAYEGRRPWLGMLMVSLFFAFWHMRFQGFLALLPISLVLGFLTWRSQSLLPAMVAHFITNGLQCAVVIANGLNSNPSAAVSQSTALVLGIMIIAGFCLGIPAAAGGLFLVWRLTAPATKGAAGQPETMAPEALVEKPSPRPRAIYFLPLLGVFAIYLFAAAMEVIDGRFPQYLPLKDMKLQTAPWSEPVAWKYELRNAAEQPVGQMECTLTPEADAFVLSCARQTTAYEIHLGNSHYYGADSEEEATYEWERSSLNLISAEVSASFKAGGENRLSVTRQGDSLSLLREDSGTRITHTFALNSLLEGEWPWRLCALPFGSRFNGARAWLTWPLRWQQDTQSSAPLTQQVYFLARGKDTVKTPAGDFQAWRVELRLAGSNELQTAWYAVDAPHTLVKYNNGSETMLLVEGMTP
jgi:hypothetical protein